MCDCVCGGGGEEHRMAGHQCKAISRREIFMVSMSTCGEGRRGLRFKQKKKGGGADSLCCAALALLTPVSLPTPTAHKERARADCGGKITGLGSATL